MTNTSACLAETPVEVESQPAPDIATVRETVKEHFPDLWPAVEVGLSTCATLLLADRVNPVALIYVGPPSAGKTTVASMFDGATVKGEALCYRSDKFTAAAFVSHSAKATTRQLTQIDLLPRIKGKVFLTPELSTMFRGKENELEERFSMITRILDGQGLTTDSGTHGRRSYVGDYLFAWIGCTTPFSPSVWRIMAQLGSRLFFLVMDQSVEVKVGDLINKTVPYKVRLTDCRQVVHHFLDHLFGHYGGVRGVQWQTEEDPRKVIKWIARCAMLLAVMRTEQSSEDTPPAPESPHRAYAVLYNLARGHALVHGRQQLTEEDLSLLAKVTLSSMPTKRREVFLALVQNKGESLTVAQVQAALRARHPDTARTVMAGLHWLGIMEYVKEGTGKAAHFGFCSEWSWCAKPSFRRLLLGRKQ